MHAYVRLISLSEEEAYIATGTHQRGTGLMRKQLEEYNVRYLG